MPGAGWLVTGCGGTLGADVVDILAAGGRLVAATDHRTLDVTDAAAVAAAVMGHDVVDNAAAYTDVDRAEAYEAEAMVVNYVGVVHLAAPCRDHGARLLHVSTNYVFSDEHAQPYTADSPTCPITAYGRSKVAGERALPDMGYVVRTAWLYGEHGASFVATMLRLAAERDVVDDQHGQPTWSRALAVQLVALGDAALAGRAAPGVYHCTAAGEATRYEVARAVYALCGLDPGRVRPTTTDRHPRPARRPAYGVLADAPCAAAGLAPLPSWRGMLAEALEQPGFRALRMAAAEPPA